MCSLIGSSATSLSQTLGRRLHNRRLANLRTPCTDVRALRSIRVTAALGIPEPKQLIESNGI